MPARTFDTDVAFTMRSTVIGQEKSCGCVLLVRIGRDLRSMLILNLKQNLEIFGLYLELVTLQLPS